MAGKNFQPMSNTATSKPEDTIENSDSGSSESQPLIRFLSENPGQTTEATDNFSPNNLVRESVRYGKRRIQDQFTKGGIQENPFLEAASLVAAQFTGTTVGTELMQRQKNSEFQDAEEKSNLTFQGWVKQMSQIQHLTEKILQENAFPTQFTQPGTDEEDADNQQQAKSGSTTSISSKISQWVSSILRPLTKIVKQVKAFWRYVKAYDHKNEVINHEYLHRQKENISEITN